MSYLRYIGLFSAAIGIAITNTTLLRADEANLPVKIITTGMPASATGIVLSSAGVKLKNGLTASKIDTSSYSVDVPLDADERSPDFLVTAFIATTEGKVIFGEMYPSSPATPAWSMDECPASAPSVAIISSNEGLLASLVKIREQRMKVSHAKISEALSGKYLERLRGIERTLIGPSDTPIGPDLAPLELIKRINVITNAIKAKQNTEKQAANSPSNP